MSAKNRLLVVGGNGYLGSAVCRAAVARGWSVSSMSSSGRPATTPAGHRRAWTNHVTWHRASAFTPSDYTDLVRESTAVVHTLGILMEGDYKRHVRSGNVFGLAGEILGAAGGGKMKVENPLMRGSGEDEGKKDGFEVMNRDSALTVLRTLLSTLPPSSPTSHISPLDKPFIYISAENIFSPLISPRYVETKRQAEVGIERLIWEYKQQYKEDESEVGASAGVRGVYVRPGLMYHPHERPLSTIPAAVLDITSRLSGHLPFSLFSRSGSSSSSSSSSSTSTSNASVKSPSGPLAALSSLSSSLSIPPIHVDQVAECVLRSIEHPQIKGIVDTRDMRRWMGLDVAEEGEEVVLPYKSSGGVVSGQRGGHGKMPFRPPAGAREYSTAPVRQTRTRTRTTGRGNVRGLRVLAPGPGQEGTSSNQQGYIIEPPSPGREDTSSGSTVRPSSSGPSEQVIDAAQVIAASPSSAGENRSTGPGNGNLNVNGNGAGSGGMGRSNHPYASMPAQPVVEGAAMSDGADPFTLLPPPAGFVPGQPGPDERPGHQGSEGGASSRTDQPGANAAGGDATTVGSTVSPTGGAATIVPQHPSPAHPFDTHAFVTHLEKSGFESSVAHSLMRSVRLLLLTRSTRARTDLLHKEDVENAAYLFKAALSELRTELNVRARTDGLALRSATNLVRREVDALDQRMREEIGGLKHDIEMDMNNRKGETRSEQKAYEISIEEINNKFTISLGDLKTEIEQAKWDATRRAITILAAIVFTVISVVTLSSDTGKPPPPPPATLPLSVEEKKYKDMGVGDDALNLREGDEEAMIRIRGLEGLRV